jgi:hypothetical protein
MGESATFLALEAYIYIERKNKGELNENKDKRKNHHLDNSGTICFHRLQPARFPHSR